MERKKYAWNIGLVSKKKFILAFEINKLSTKLMKIKSELVSWGNRLLTPFCSNYVTITLWWELGLKTRRTHSTRNCDAVIHAVPRNFPFLRGPVTRICLTLQLVPIMQWRAGIVLLNCSAAEAIKTYSEQLITSRSLSRSWDAVIGCHWILHSRRWKGRKSFKMWIEAWIMKHAMIMK